MIRTLFALVFLGTFAVQGWAQVSSASVEGQIQATSHRDSVKAYWDARYSGFFKNPAVPLDSADSVYLSYYDPDMVYQVRARVEMLFGEQPFQMSTYAGTTAEYVRYALAYFRIEEGPEQILTLYRNTSLFANPAYKDYLFVPFLDLTNGEETYVGGRYLDLSAVDIQNGYLNIDFNRAYNPYCAFSNGYRCPIPPKDNHLSIEIRAGERKYTGSMKERP